MPRARRLKGLMREDAALDAMKQYGFSVDLVKKKLKELLQIYGGDCGWAFIEDASYKLLIEVILEDEEPGDGTVKATTGGNIAESSSAALSEDVPNNALLDVAEIPTESPIRTIDAQPLDAALNKENIDEGENLVKEANGGENEESAGFPDSHGGPDVYQLCVAEVSKINQPDEIPSNAPINAVCISVEKKTLSDHSDGQTASHMRPDQDLSSKEDPNFVDNGNVSMRIDNVARHIGSDAKKTEFQHLHPCVESPIRTRRKCYGWIGNSDDEDDVIDLRKIKSHKLDGDVSGGAKNLGGRKGRWDMKPEVWDKLPLPIKRQKGLACNNSMPL
uniref:WIYLD domain-containing protein n=1 Tax=Kalanchoe fedtschenkoi TaxID=63787 RepID=A0A7N0T6G1_KALFE